MVNYFSKNMTHDEARAKLFEIIVGKSEKQREEINAAYQAVLPEILDNEVKRAQKGIMS